MEPDVCFRSLCLMHALGDFYLHRQKHTHTWICFWVHTRAHTYNQKSLQGSLGLITELDDMIRNRIFQKWPLQACSCLRSMLAKQPSLPTTRMMLLLVHVGLYWPRDEQHTRLHQRKWKQWKIVHWKLRGGMVQNVCNTEHYHELNNKYRDSSVERKQE